MHIYSIYGNITLFYLRSFIYLAWYKEKKTTSFFMSLLRRVNSWTEQIQVSNAVELRECKRDWKKKKEREKKRDFRMFNDLLMLNLILRCTFSIFILCRFHCLKCNNRVKERKKDSIRQFVLWNKKTYTFLVESWFQQSRIRESELIFRIQCMNECYFICYVQYKSLL